MIANAKIKVLSYRKKEFISKADNRTVKFNQIEFCDDEGNKFTASVPAANVDQIGIEFDQEGAGSGSIEGDAELLITSAPSRNGFGSTTKIQVTEFKPNH